MKLADLIAAYERQVADAERLQSSAPVASVFAAVVEDLRHVEAEVGTEPQVDSTVQGRLLSANEAAALLGVNKTWLYRRANRLPFARRLSKKVIRFEESGLRRWLAKQRAT